MVEPEIRTKYGKNYNRNALERERDVEILCVFGHTLAVRNPRSRLNAFNFDQKQNVGCITTTRARDRERVIDKIYSERERERGEPPYVFGPPYRT